MTGADIGGGLSALGIAGLAAFAAFKAMAASDRAGDVKGDLGELRVALIGIDGKNGVRGEVKALQSIVAENETRSEQRHSQVIEALNDIAPPRKRRRAS